MQDRTDNALKLIKYENLFKLVNFRTNIRSPIAYEHLLENTEALTKLNNCLADVQIQRLVGVSLFHPSLDELLNIIDNDLIKKLFQVNQSKSRFLMRQDLTSQAFLEILNYDTKVLAKVIGLLNNQNVDYLCNKNLLSIADLRGFDSLQEEIFTNEAILSFLIPGLMPLEYTGFSIGDEPLLSIQRAKVLTQVEFDVLTNPIYYEALCRRQIGVEELLLKHNQFSTKIQLELYTTKKAVLHHLYKNYFPTASVQLLQGLDRFDSEFITSIFEAGKPDNVKNLQALLSLSSEAQNKLMAIEPRAVLKLFFKYINLQKLSKSLQKFSVLQFLTFANFW